jgi:hypothetical protein
MLAVANVAISFLRGRRSDLKFECLGLGSAAAERPGRVVGPDSEPRYKRSPHDASIRILRTPTHTYAVRTPTRNPLAGHRRPNAERYVETHCYDNVRDPHQLTNPAEMQETADLRRDLAATLVARIREVEMVEPSIATK